MKRPCAKKMYAGEPSQPENTLPVRSGRPSVPVYYLLIHCLYLSPRPTHVRANQHPLVKTPLLQVFVKIFKNELLTPTHTST